MASASPSSRLESLPPELLTPILRRLDPIALIAVSQTSSKLRTSINPQKEHFLERLLTLECDPEIGGPEYTFDGPGVELMDTLSPVEEYNRIRHACSGCLRLRSQLYFLHHHINGLAYRKPPTPVPGSDASGVRLRPMTSWSGPTLRGKPGSRRAWERRKVDGTLDAEKRLKAECYYVWNQEWIEGPDLEIEWELEKCRLARTGYKRHHRLCVECIFQRGEWGKRKMLRSMVRVGAYGSPTAPVVEMRTWTDHLYQTQADRWFPGVLDLLMMMKEKESAAAAAPNPRPSPLYSWGGQHRWETPATQAIHPYTRAGHYGGVKHPFMGYMVTPLFVARCTQCQSWRELRSFRVYPADYPSGVMEFRHWDTEKPVRTISPDDMTCNACFARRDGHEALANELVAWLRHLVLIEMKMMHKRPLLWLNEEIYKLEHCSARPEPEMAKVMESANRMKVMFRILHADDVNTPWPGSEKIGEEEIRLALSDFRGEYDKWKIPPTYNEYQLDKYEESWLWMCQCRDKADSVKNEDGWLVEWALKNIEPRV